MDMMDDGFAPFFKAILQFCEKTEKVISIEITEVSRFFFIEV